MFNKCLSKASEFLADTWKSQVDKVVIQRTKGRYRKRSSSSISRDKSPAAMLTFKIIQRSLLQPTANSPEKGISVGSDCTMISLVADISCTRHLYRYVWEKLSSLLSKKIKHVSLTYI